MILIPSGSMCYRMFHTGCSDYIIFALRAPACLPPACLPALGGLLLSLSFSICDACFRSLARVLRVKKNEESIPNTIRVSHSPVTVRTYLSQ